MKRSYKKLFLFTLTLLVPLLLSAKMTTITGTVTNVSCQQDPVPCPDCLCDDQIVDLSLRYQGPDGATVTASLSSSLGAELGSFSVNDGDVFTVMASSAGVSKLENNTYFQVNGGADFSIHTSCSDDIAGLSFNELTVVGFMDVPGNVCDFTGLNCYNAACACDGGIEILTVRYDGADGASVVVSTEVMGDLGTYSVNNGDILVLEAADAGLSKLKSNTSFSVDGGADIDIHTSCSQDILGGSFGPITVVGYNDVDGNVCTILPPCDGAIDLVVPPTGGPYSFLWSNGATTEDLSGICAGVYSVIITNGAGATETRTFTVLECPECPPSVLSLSGTVTNSACPPPIPPPCPTCICDDQIVDLVLRYEGPDGGTVVASLNSGLGGELGTFSVNDGDIITVQASSAGGAELENNTYFEVNGGADFSIHTSCSDDIAGLTFNELTVVGFTDVPGNVCDLTLSIDDCLSQECECNGGIRELTLRYDGPAGGTLVASSESTLGGNLGSYAVSPGQVIIILASDAGLSKLKSNTFFEVNGGTAFSIHTSCSQDILGLSFGELTVVGWLDDNGGLCETEPETPCTGAIDLSVSGIPGTYTYLWSNGATTEDVSGLCPGDYSVTVFLDGLCQSSMDFSVGSCDPCSPDLSITGSVVNAACDTTPEPVYCPTCVCEGGMVALTVRYNGPNGATLEAERDDPADLGTFTVNDGDIITVFAATDGATKLKGDTRFFVNGGSEIKFHTSCSRDIAGQSLGDGTAQITVLGWEDEDGNVCDWSSVIDICVVNNCECAGGIQELQLQWGGAPGATVDAWYDGVGTGSLGSFGPLAPGDLFTVRSADVGQSKLKSNTTFVVNGGSDFDIHTSCSQDILGLEFSGLTVTGWLDAEDNTCFIVPGPVCDGSIDIAVAGGSGNYTFLWSNGATTEDISGLCAGDYTVTVIDDGVCSSEMTFHVGDCDPIAVDDSATVCQGDMTTIDVLANDSDPDDGLDPSSVTILSGPAAGIAMVQPDGSIKYSHGGGAAGSDMLVYQVSDFSGLNASATVHITVLSAPSLSGIVEPVTCPGDSSGAIDLSASGGTAPYLYLWEDGSTMEDRSGLPAGVYSVVVTDANGCMDSVNFVLVDGDGPEFVSITMVPASSCKSRDGGLIIDLVGGSPPYDILINGVRSVGPFASSPISLIGVQGGTVVTSLLVTDANGCSASNDSIYVVGSPPSPLIASVMPVNATCGASDGALIIDLDDAQPGMPAYRVRVDGVIYGPFASEPITIGGLAAGPVNQIMVLDAKFCLATLSGVIEIGCDSLPCPPPDGLFSTVNGRHTADLYWNAVFEGTGDYILQIRELGTTAFTIIEVSDTTRHVGGLAPATTYEWCVRTICGPITSDCSPLQTFTTASPRIGEPGTVDVRLQPNPTDGPLYLTIDLEQRQSLRIEVLSHDGRLILTRVTGNVDRYEDLIDLSGQADGLYFVKWTDASGHTNAIPFVLSAR